MSVPVQTGVAARACREKASSAAMSAATSSQLKRPASQRAGAGAPADMRIEVHGRENARKMRRNG
jgi:hypothetical protein